MNLPLTNNTFNSTMENETVYINYCINNVLLGMNTLFQARVDSVNGLRATITPLINLIATNQPSPLPTTIENVPICQLIGGISGIEVKLKPGDVVYCGANQRDISNAKNDWTKQTNPASARKFSMSDAIKLNVLSNNLPTNKIKITDEGIEITGPGLPVTITSQSVTVNADEVKLGNSAANKILLENVSMTATIGGVQAGGGVTGVPMTITAGGSSKVEAAI